MASFCSECGVALVEGALTCASCGTPVPDAASLTPKESAVPKHPRRGRLLRRLLVSLVALLAIVGGGMWYLVAPDLPPGGPLTLLPNPARLTARLPIIGYGGGKASAPLPGEAKARDALSASLSAAPGAQIERQIQQQLVATGLPVTVVTMTTTPAGKSALVVGLDASKLTSGGNFDGGLASGVDGIVKLVKSKALDVTVAEHIVIAIADAQGRPLFSAAAPSSAIVQFRDGKLTQKDFLKSTAIQAQSRVALLEAIRNGVGR